MHQFPTHQWKNKLCSDECIKDFPLNSREYTVIVAASNSVIILPYYWCGLLPPEWKDLYFSSLNFSVNLHNEPKKKKYISGWNFNWNRLWEKMQKKPGISRNIFQYRKSQHESQNVHFWVLKLHYFQISVRKLEWLTLFLKYSFKRVDFKDSEFW